MVVAPGDDLSLGWTIDGSAAVHVRVLASDEDVFDAVVCEFDGDALQGTIPTALLPSLPGIIYAFTRVDEHVAVGSFDVTLRALDLSHEGQLTVE